MLVFFFPFFLKISAVTYTTACARAYGFVFERHQRSDFFVEKLYGMRARLLSARCMLARARAGPPATAWLLSEYSEAALCGAASECPGRESRSRRRGRPRARAGKHALSESTRAHAVQLLNEKNRCADAFQKQNRTRARKLSYT